LIKIRINFFSYYLLKEYKTIKKQKAMGKMVEPQRKKPMDNKISHLDFEYMEEMVKYYEYTNTEVDLSKFADSEICIHPFLYKVYISKFNK
jgi:hypothetical protein